MKVVWMTPEEYCVDRPRWAIDFGTHVRFQPYFSTKEEAELYIKFLKDKPIQNRIKEALKPVAIETRMIARRDEYELTPEEFNRYMFEMPLPNWEAFYEAERKILTEEFEIYREKAALIGELK